MRRWISRVSIFSFLIILIISYQNCGESFQSQEASQRSLLSQDDTSEFIPINNENDASSTNADMEVNDDSDARLTEEVKLLTIKSVATESITVGSAIIHWEVSDYNQGYIEYGKTSSYGFTTTLERSFKYLAHKQKIIGLDADSLYHFKVHSVDSQGKKAAKEGTFKTLKLAQEAMPEPVRLPTSVTIPASQPVTMPKPEVQPILATGNSHSFGQSFGSWALANLRVGYRGIRVASPFKAKSSSQISQIMAYWTWSFKRTGYHKGNGGIIKVDIVNDVSGKPGSVVYSTGTIVPNLTSASRITTFKPLSMSAKKNVVKGNKYWILFSNIHSDPENNHLSVNSMWGENGYFTNKITDSEFGRSWSSDGKGNWGPSFHHLVHQIKYADNSVHGYGTIGGFGFSTQINFGGSKQVRQKFKVSKDNEIKNIWVRIGRKSGKGSATLSLRDVNNNLIASTVVASDKIPLQVGERPSNHDWVLFPLTANLKANQTYYAVLTAPNTTTYFAHPTQTGKSYNFDPITFAFGGNYAEHSTNNGSSWSGWKYNSSSNRKDAELQIYFNKGY